MPVASLSKEFPLDQIEAALMLARGGMKFQDYRGLVGKKVHPDIPALVRGRFLLIENGLILHDHFLSIIKSEGVGTPRTRKIMYGAWVLRDRRLLEFVTKILASENGLWSAEDVADKTNAAFFEKFFKASTTAKIRSNFEYFLIESGIFQNRNSPIELSLDDGWLAEAVVIASQQSEFEGFRDSMMGDPHSFIIAQGWQGIANATTDQLLEFRRSIPNSATESDSALTTAPGKSLNGTVWSKKAPAFNDLKILTVQVDAVKRERASLAHHSLEAAFSQLAQGRGYLPQFNEHIDLFFDTPTETLLIEVKSCTRNTVHTQVRRGVAQLLEYEFVYREQYNLPVAKVLLLETAVPPNLGWILDFLNDLNISLIWRDSSGALKGAPTLRQSILELLQD